jgi:hypothetical protein
MHIMRTDLLFSCKSHSRLSSQEERLMGGFDTGGQVKNDAYSELEIVEGQA